jgi:hypothetical protein
MILSSLNRLRAYLSRNPLNPIVNRLIVPLYLRDPRLALPSGLDLDFSLADLGFALVFMIDLTIYHSIFVYSL